MIHNSVQFLDRIGFVNPKKVNELFFKITLIRKNIWHTTHSVVYANKLIHFFNHIKIIFTWTRFSCVSFGDVWVLIYRYPYCINHNKKYNSYHSIQMITVLVHIFLSIKDVFEKKLLSLFSNPDAYNTIRTYSCFFWCLSILHLTVVV